MSDTTEAQAQFPLYLVVAYNNLHELITRYRETGDTRLLLEALLVSCIELKRLADDDGFWRSIDEVVDGSTREEVRVDLPRDFDYEGLFGLENELLLQAAVRRKSVDRLIDDLREAKERADRRDAPRFVRRLRGRIMDVRNATCDRHREFLESNGFPKDVASIAGRIVVVRTFYIVGGAVIAGVDVFGSVHVPPLAPFAKQSVDMGIDLMEHGLTGSEEELAALFG